MQIEIKPDRICNVHLPKVIKHLLLKTKVVTRLSFTKTLASLLTNITVQQEVKPPPEQFNSRLENPIQILISADTRSPDTLYKLPSKVTDPLLGLLFLRALSCRLCWVCLLSMWSHGAVADGQQTPELLVFNLELCQSLFYRAVTLVIHLHGLTHYLTHFTDPLQLALNLLGMILVKAEHRFGIQLFLFHHQLKHLLSVSTHDQL